MKTIVFPLHFSVAYFGNFLSLSFHLGNSIANEQHFFYIIFQSYIQKSGVSFWNLELNFFSKHILIRVTIPSTIAVALSVFLFLSSQNIRKIDRSTFTSTKQFLYFIEKQGSELYLPYMLLIEAYHQVKIVSSKAHLYKLHNILLDFKIYFCLFWKIRSRNLPDLPPVFSRWLMWSLCDIIFNNLRLSYLHPLHYLLFQKHIKEQSGPWDITPPHFHSFNSMACSRIFFFTRSESRYLSSMTKTVNFKAIWHHQRQLILFSNTEPIVDSTIQFYHLQWGKHKFYFFDTGFSCLIFFLFVFMCISFA